ncbi:MAG: cytochrome c biogenesis protein ResB [Lentimicrobiaceae bacterium]|nr:cytochrome c biogenesis protein ResB [Lentimicrobiaceae bacterium]
MKTALKYLRLVLPHLGIAFIILAMVLGLFYNWRGKAVLLTTDKTNVFITNNNELKIVPYALTLTQFNITHYDTGEPKCFEAIIEVEENNETQPIALFVNHPYKMAFGQDLYLISYHYLQPENEVCCVVELVHEPFQGIFLAGIIFLMVGLLLNLLTLFYFRNPKF